MLGGMLLVGVAMAAEKEAGPVRPGRVVSLNLCTDQLALMLADPGQVISVSALAHDPQVSLLAEQARSIPPNRGSAEEIYLMKPDLVLAGPFSTVATSRILSRLGIRVAMIEPAYTLADVAARLRQLGRLLGHPERGEAMASAYETRLRQFAMAARPGIMDGMPGAGNGEQVSMPLLATYSANGYMAGSASITGELITLSGFASLAEQLGYRRGGSVPLEDLILADPAVIITSRPERGQSRAEAVLAHPALRKLQARHVGAVTTDRDWVCGTPQLASVLRRLVGLRQQLGTSLIPDAAQGEAER